MDKDKFIKNVEQMIDPIEVGTIHYMQSFSEKIPKTIQNKMIEGGAKKNPYMGFVVEPYSFFLCHEIVDLDQAKQLLPDNYKMVKTHIFKDDKPKYYAIFGAFNVHSSAFWGTRMEFYIIAENIDTGLLSWVIIDYDTNTVSYDEKRGLHSGTTDICVLTTDYDGQIHVDIQNKRANRQLIVNADITRNQTKDIDQRLWLEGNLSVTYGRELSLNKGKSFAVTFHPREVRQAMEIELEAVNILANTWFPGLLDPQPSKVVSFKYAQHYLSDSPGHYSQIMNQEQLLEQYNSIDFDTMPKYSSAPIKRSMMIGQLISFSLIIILTILLILK